MLHEVEYGRALVVRLTRHQRAVFAVALVLAHAQEQQHLHHRAATAQHRVERARERVGLLRELRVVDHVGRHAHRDLGPLERRRVRVAPVPRDAAHLVCAWHMRSVVKIRVSLRPTAGASHAACHARHALQRVQAVPPYSRQVDRRELDWCRTACRSWLRFTLNLRFLIWLGTSVAITRVPRVTVASRMAMYPAPQPSSRIVCFELSTRSRSTSEKISDALQVLLPVAPLGSDFSWKVLSP
mmetsp:Transcript_58586/g.155676  ORF Transcript_58586/g.155676 Transcript_58586/m.155676 type:complete len:241 (-) Transcript_58586:72-794(-)|eukprot:7376695-Prymnesium_polylepis.1